MYEFRCPCGTIRERLYLSYKEAPRGLNCKACGDYAPRVPSVPKMDFLSEARANMLANDLVVVEDGMDRQIDETRASMKAQYDNELSKAVEDTVNEHSHLGSISTQ